MSQPTKPTIVPLGDQALLISWANEQTAIGFAQVVRQANPSWLWDVVPAYKSVGVYFDPTCIRFAEVQSWLEKVTVDTGSREMGKLHRIPCCYELALDLMRVEEHTGRSKEEIIQRHTATEYTVYAIGFCPGFPYLGYLPEELAGVPRLPTPRLRVEPGSVGLTGRQTGLYPLPRPGGWNIVGRTPLIIVDVEAGFFPISVGDRVRFERLDEAEYSRLLGERLPIDPNGHAS